MKTVKNNLRRYGINPAKGRRYENITYVLALAYNLMKARIDAYLASHGLSSSEFNLLMLAAYQNEGLGLSQVELSKRLIVSASNITKLTDKAVKAGFIVRKTNPQSRRENIICIAQKGQNLIDEIWPGYDKLVSGMTEKIPPADRLHAERILNDWFNALQEDK